MDTIVKDGVVNLSFGRDGNTSERREEQKRSGFNPDIVRDSEVSYLINAGKKYETPGFRIRRAIANFRKKQVSDVNIIGGVNSELYTRSNLIDNNHNNIVKDHITALHITKDRVYKVNNDFDLTSTRGFYENNEMRIRTVGKLDREIIAPIRKIDKDEKGIRFLSSVGGFKNTERSEMFTQPVPILRNAAAVHGPISIISNGTKRVTRINQQ